MISREELREAIAKERYRCFLAGSSGTLAFANWDGLSDFSKHVWRNSVDTDTLLDLFDLNTEEPISLLKLYDLDAEYDETVVPFKSSNNYVFRQRRNVKVEAFRMTRENQWALRQPQWLRDAWNKPRTEVGALFVNSYNYSPTPRPWLRTPGATEIVPVGHFIVHDSEGSLSLWSPTFFHETYEKVATPPLNIEDRRISDQRSTPRRRLLGQNVRGRRTVSVRRILGRDRRNPVKLRRSVGRGS